MCILLNVTVWVDYFNWNTMTKLYNIQPITPPLDVKNAKKVYNFSKLYMNLCQIA